MDQAQPTPTQPIDRRPTYIFPWLLLALAAAAGIAGASSPAAREGLARLLTATQDMGIQGQVLVAAIYIICCLLFLPGSIMTLAAGFLFGTGQAIVLVSIAATLGAAIAFLLGRHLLRHRVASWIQEKPRLANLDRAVGDQGFKIVLLTRLSPAFPFNLLNFAFGLTNVRFRDYLLASWIGMLPGTVVYSWAGAAARSLSAALAGDVEGGAADRALFVAGLIATIVVTVILTRMAQQALDQATHEHQPDPQ